MRRLIGTLAVVSVLAALTSLIGCGGGGGERALTGSAVSPAGGKPAPPPAYTVTDLSSSVTWGAMMEPNAINDSGQVAGRLGIGMGNVGSAWVWDNGNLSELPNPPGCTGNGYVLGINSGGDIVGRVATPLPAPGHMSPVVWVAPPGSAGSYTALELPMPAAPPDDTDASGQAWAINASREAVGRDGLGGGSEWFLWTPIYGTDPCTPTGFAYQQLADGITLYDINDNHQAVGRDAAGAGRWEWSGGVWAKTLVPLPSGGTGATGLQKINAAGDVTGGYTGSDGKNRSFVWQSGATDSVDIGLLSGCVTSTITDINSSGVVVGCAQTTPDRRGQYRYLSFVGTPVRTGGAITSYNLQDLTTVAGLQQVFHYLGEVAPVINDAGAIACRGTAIRNSNVSRPLLLIRN
jgi:hypothetical protein